MQQYEPNNFRYRDRCLATTFALGSAIGQLIPRAADVVGHSDHPRHVPLQWRYARGIHPSAYHPDWQRFPGNTTSGETPKKYVDVAILRFDRESIELAGCLPEARQAVAYVLGTSAVMIGTSREPEIFGIDENNEDRLTVAMRIGKGTLWAAAGVYSPHVGFFALPFANVERERQAADTFTADIPLV